MLFPKCHLQLQDMSYRYHLHVSAKIAGKYLSKFLGVGSGFSTIGFVTMIKSQSELAVDDPYTLLPHW